MRGNVFWPGISAEIKCKFETCDVCREFEISQNKEPLTSHDVPDRPWAKVGCDILSFEGRDYLVTSDHSTATKIIMKLKAHFARHGIPDVLVSDNGAQFTSD